MFWGIQILVYISCKKSYFFKNFTHAYHTGSAFRQHYYVCRVLTYTKTHHETYRGKFS